jgi:hypothetical protein
MGTTDISNTKSNGDVIDETWYNDLRSALIGNFVPRNASSGVVDNSAPDLGALIYPWGNLYASGLVINGVAIDFTTVTGIPNSIKSGQTRTTSDFPDFIRATGSTNSFTLLASAVNLVVDINTQETVFTTDQTETGLTLAPTIDNTCLLDDANAAGQYETSYLGEDNTVITIDNAGTEITNRIGQFCLFQTGTEYFLAYIKSATELTNAYRGFLLDSSGNPVNRTVLNDNDVITLLSGGWVFVDQDGVTVDVTYNSPIYDFVEPVSPVTGDYWFNREEQAWYRYSGTAFVIIDRTLVGVVAIDIANCVASRSFNFNREYNDYNPLNLQYVDATTVQADLSDFVINVYGNKVVNQSTRYLWDITTNLESGQVETSSTYYYFYITQDGEQIISDIKPYDQKGEIGGYYHPYNTWRAIGAIANDFSNNFVEYSLATYEKKLQVSDVVFNLTDIFYKPVCGDITRIKVRFWAGGAGGSRGAGSGGSGGAGGGYGEFIFKYNELPIFNTIIIGAGGAGRSSFGDGATGGTTFFNANAVYGGVSANGPISDITEVQGGSVLLNELGRGIWYAGYPGYVFNQPAPGNNVPRLPEKNIVYGGAGGGSPRPTLAERDGGVSLFGGNGGRGGSTAGSSGLPGQIPGGGGGGSSGGTTGSGANGQVIIEYW